MKITRNEVEKLLATIYRLEATEVELNFDFSDYFTVNSIDFDIYKFEYYFTTALTIENEKG